MSGSEMNEPEMNEPEMNEPEMHEGATEWRPDHPVYLYEEGVELPDTGTYYVVSKDGIYLHKEINIGSALVKVEEIPFLRQLEPDVKLNLPKIPGMIIAQAHRFFQMVWHKHRSESEVQLYYSAPLNQYKLHCPTQEVTGGSVHYDRLDRLPLEELKLNGPNFQLVGTIHSHCNFSAFHSGVDIGDEEDLDGIHVTLGHVDRDEFSMATSIAVNAHREQFDPGNCCSGLKRVDNTYVKKSYNMTWGDSTFFSVELSEEEQEQLELDVENFREHWLTKVTAGSYRRSQSSYYGGGKRESRKRTGNWWDWD